MSENNKERILAKVVSIEAWYAELNNIGDTAKVHVDLAFQTDRLGNELDAEVSFRLALRRAELWIVVPYHEAVCVLPQSVARDEPIAIGEKKLTFHKGTNFQAKAGTKAKGSADGASGSFEGGIDIGCESGQASEIQLTQEIRGVIVRQSRSETGEYRWSFEPTVADQLFGRGWNAKEEPRLEIRAEKGFKPNIQPAIRLEIRCLKEDIRIDDIQFRDPTRMEKLLSAVNMDKKLAVAEAYLRAKFLEKGLEVENFDHRFGRLQIAWSLAQPVKEGGYDQ